MTVTARHIFVDETKQRGYVLVATRHLATDMTPLRHLVRHLLLPKQRYLHMKDERDGRKRTIARAFVAAGVQAILYRAGAEHPNERQRRAACLRAVIDDNADASDAILILDQDDTLLRWDNQRLIEFTREAGCRETLRYEHRRANAEPLLAIPDAIAWCWAKGGEWKQLIQPAVTCVRDV